MKQTLVHLRWGDIDILGHVYNGYYQHYFDAGKSDYFNATLGLSTVLSEDGVGLVTANTNTNFYESILPHNKVMIETIVERLGTKGITMFQRIVDRASGVVKADSRSVMVCINIAQSCSVEIPQRWRANIVEELGFGDL
ncbi:MAG: thioesterase family protein [Mucinivorans sp.]